mgnify:CR=1 FL=1
MTTAKSDAFGNADWKRLLRTLGEDPDRQGLVETPERVRKAWAHWTRGYQEDPASILKMFEDGSEHYNELIVVRKIPVYSHCEHHLAPFFGHAAIGYLPNGHIVGLSKLTRLVNCFAGASHATDRRITSSSSAPTGGRRHHSLPPYVHGIARRCGAGRRDGDLGDAGRSAEQSRAAQRVSVADAPRLVAAATRATQHAEFRAVGVIERNLFFRIR